MVVASAQVGASAINWAVAGKAGLPGARGVLSMDSMSEMKCNFTQDYAAANWQAVGPDVPQALAYICDLWAHSTMLSMRDTCLQSCDLCPTSSLQVLVRLVNQPDPDQQRTRSRILYNATAANGSFGGVVVQSSQHNN